MPRSIMSDLGLEWDDGTTIPVANVENKLLEEQILKLEQENTQLRNGVSDQDDRVHAMSEHLKNVKQELLNTQGLANARKQEIESELHMHKVSEREEGRLRQEIQKQDKNLEELKEKRNVDENKIFKQTQKLEETRSQMNWDQQALEAWLEESARKDEDAMILSKYTRMDEGKVKELTLKIEHLTTDCAQRRHQLETETTETLTAQIELDKTAEEFRKAHADRRKLIEQWEHTIEAMQKRDKEMDMLAVQLSRLKEEVRRLEENIKEKQKFLDGEVDNNAELEKRISLAERTAGKVRNDYQEAESQRDQFQNELDALKRTVDRTAMDLENTRGQVKALKKETAEKQDRLRHSKNMNEALNEKLKSVMESELSAEERAAQLEQELELREAERREIEQQLKKLRDLLFKRTQDLHDARTQEKDTDAVIMGGKAAIRNLNSKITKLDHDSLKQQEIIYNQDFAIQQLERRISRMQGEQSNEDKLALEAKIKRLNEDLDQQRHTHNLLSNQRKRLLDDVRRVKRDLEKTNAAKSELGSKIAELELHNTTSESALNTLIKAKRSLMVDENLLKLQIHDLRKMLNSRADEVMTLEKRRLQLETAMKERRLEINVHKDMLEAQLRSAENERTQNSMELHNRIKEIDMLKKRFEIQTVSMAPPEGEEEKSQAYYVIKAAQEKETLQRTGDQLDEEIKRREKEIRALENTLRLMNDRNETQRKSFNKVTETSEEMEQKDQLEEQNRAVMDKYKYKRRQIRELQEDLQTMSHTLDRLARDESAYGELLDERQARIKQMETELNDQEAKMERASKLTFKLQREIRSAAKTKDQLPEERDCAVRELREMNKKSIKVMGEVVHQYPDTSQSVHLYFNQANLPPPPSPGPGSRQSSRPSSSRSSLSSHSSRIGKTPSQSAPKQAISMGGADFGLAGSPMGSARSSASSRSGRGSRR